MISQGSFTAPASSRAHMAPPASRRLAHMRQKASPLSNLTSITEVLIADDGSSHETNPVLPSTSYLTGKAMHLLLDLFAHTVKATILVLLRPPLDMPRSRLPYLSDGFESDYATSPPLPSSRPRIKLDNPSHYHDSDNGSDPTRLWVNRLVAATTRPSNIKIDNTPYEHPMIVSAASKAPNRLRKSPGSRPRDTTSLYSQSSLYSQQSPPPPQSPPIFPSSFRYSSAPSTPGYPIRNIASPAPTFRTATSISTTATGSRKLSSISWLSTRSVDSAVLAGLSNPSPAPGATPSYLTALGSYLGGAPPTPSEPTPQRFSSASEPFDYGSERRRAAAVVKDRDSLERITLAERPLPPLPPLPPTSERKSRSRSVRTPQHHEKEKEKERAYESDTPVQKKELKSILTKRPNTGTNVTFTEQQHPGPRSASRPPKNPRRTTLDPILDHPPPSSFPAALLSPVLPPIAPLRISKVKSPTESTFSEAPLENPKVVEPKSFVQPTPIVAPQPRPIIRAKSLARLRPATSEGESKSKTATATAKCPDDVWSAVQSLRTVSLNDDDFAWRAGTPSYEYEDEDAYISLAALTLYAGRS